MGTVVTIDVYTTDGTAGTGLSRQLAAARAILDQPRTVAATDLLQVARLIVSEWEAPTDGVPRGAA